MESQAKTRTEAITKVNYLQDAYDGDTCPYCGTKAQDLSKHISKCKVAKQNQKAEYTQSQWALHEVAGKVMVLSITDGLALVENDAGRYAIPVLELQFTDELGPILQTIENSSLSDSAIEKLINILRVKNKSFMKLPAYPELWPGCRVELRMGNKVQKATIDKRRGKGYVAIVDGYLTGITIYNKNIVGIIG